MNIENVLEGYLTALLWSTSDGELESLEGFELAPEALEQCRADCARFVAIARIDLIKYEKEGGFPMPEQYAGHDFWLTRAGHGVGFWDRGLGALGDRLTATVKANFKNVDPYIGDDGKVYLS